MSRCNFGRGVATGGALDGSRSVAGCGEFVQTHLSAVAGDCHVVAGGSVAVMAAVMAAVITPWTWRNGRVSGGEFLPVATEQGGMTTFVGNYQPTAGLWEGPDKLKWLAAVAEIKQQNAGATVVGLDRAFYHAAWEQVSANPVGAA